MQTEIKNRADKASRVDVDQVVFTLRHLETAEYICLRHDAKEYMACFKNAAAAAHFRAELGLVEFVDVAPLRLSDAPFDHYWLDGDMIGRNALASAQPITARA